MTPVSENDLRRKGLNERELYLGGLPKAYQTTLTRICITWTMSKVELIEIVW